MKTFLISGLGPARIENEDLLGSFFDDYNIDVKTKFSIDGRSISPLDLVYTSNNGESVPVLRLKSKEKKETYISELLKGILYESDEEFEFIDISLAWKNVELNPKEKEAVVLLSTTFMWNTKMINMAVDWVYANFDSPVLVLGGQYSTLKLEYIVNNLFDKVDYIISGAAELSLVDLIKTIDHINSKNYHEIPNLWYKENGRFVFTFNKKFNYKDSKIVKFKGERKTMPYMSMRGCPYSCKFCALRECTPCWQFLSAERILQDWDEYAKENNSKHFTIRDSTFFIPYTKIEKLLPQLKGRNYIWTANSRVDTPFNQEVVRQLEDAGCITLFFGFESMCDETLLKMDKRTTSSLNRKINSLFGESSILTAMSFIVGFPGETPSDFEYTHDYLVNEHIGRFTLYVFEYEGDILPIAKEKEKYQIEVYDDDEKYNWAHGGQNWKHIGMDSNKAKLLRRKTIKDSRANISSNSVFSSWQGKYQWPFVQGLSKMENIKIEKLIDRLIFLFVDFPADYKREAADILKALSYYDIHIKE